MVLTALTAARQMALMVARLEETALTVARQMALTVARLDETALTAARLEETDE